MFSSSYAWLPLTNYWSLLLRKYFGDFHEAGVNLPSSRGSMFALLGAWGCHHLETTTNRGHDMFLDPPRWCTWDTDAIHIKLSLWTQFFRNNNSSLHFFFFPLFNIMAAISTVAWIYNNIVYLRFILILWVKSFGIPIKLFLMFFAYCILHNFRAHNLHCSVVGCCLPSWSFAVYNLCSGTWWACSQFNMGRVAPRLFLLSSHCDWNSVLITPVNHTTFSSSVWYV